MTTVSDKKHIRKTIQEVLTHEDVDAVAEKYTNDKSVQVLDYQIEDYSTIKTGVSKSYRSIKITLQESNSNIPKTVSFFLKVIPYEFQPSRDFLLESGIFLKESLFYDKMIPQLGKNFNCEKWFSTCFLRKRDAIILEDLRTDGYKVLGTKLFDNTAAVKSALVAVARLHGSSIVVESRLNRDCKQPIPLNERYADVLHERFFTRSKWMDRYINNCNNVSCVLAKNLGYDPESIRKAYERAYEMPKPSKTYRNVIGHGDLWFNNMMFSDDLENCILVDFQIARYAPIAIDLLQLLHLHTSRLFREKNEKSLIEFYHTNLEKTIRDNDAMECMKVPEIKEIFASMDEFRLYGLVTAALHFPFSFMDPKDMANYTKDTDSYNRFVFGDRVDLTLSYLKKDEPYRIRNEECIIELAEKCKLLLE